MATITVLHLPGSVYPGHRVPLSVEAGWLRVVVDGEIDPPTEEMRRRAAGQ